MLRACDFSQISDGHTYQANDMVKADTCGCEGCHKCCTGMGNSIVLDPFDIWRMCFLSGKEDMGFEELLARGKVELNLVDGLILPNLRMNEKDACSFLNDEGRCTIHAVRPAICRLFPLGRVYGDEGFSYFLQKGECAKENRVKIKVKKWIDTPNLQKNEEFVLSWHTFIRMVGDLMIELKKKGTSELMNEIAMYVLNTFYVKTILFSEADANTGKDLDVLAYEKLIAMIDEASAKIKGWIH